MVSGRVIATFFHVDSFGYAMLGALIVSNVSGVLNVLTGGTKARVSFQRRPPPSDKKQDDDGHRADR